MLQNYKHFRCKEISIYPTNFLIFSNFFEFFFLNCNNIQVLSYKLKTIHLQKKKTNQGSFFLLFFTPQQYILQILLTFQGPLSRTPLLSLTLPGFLLQIWHPLSISLSNSSEQSCSSPGLSKQSQSHIPRVQFAVTTL